MTKSTNARKTPNYIDQLRERIDRTKHQLADWLSGHFERLPLRTRKFILIVTGILIAALSFSMIFGSSYVQVSRDHIRPPNTSQSSPDSVASHSDSTVRQNLLDRKH